MSYKCNNVDVPALQPNDPTIANRAYLQAVVHGLFCERWSCTEREAVAKLLGAEPPQDPIFANLPDADLEKCVQRSKFFLSRDR